MDSDTMRLLALQNAIINGRYRVTSRLSKGSYAEIFKALDMEDDSNPVVIKALNTYLNGKPEYDLEATLFENFKNEADLLGALYHPNIIQLVDRGISSDSTGVSFHY